MADVFAPIGTPVSVSATASSVATTLTMTSPANALYIVNTSATLFVTANFSVGAQAAVLGTTGVTIPPMSSVLVEANALITNVAAIGSGAGPTIVTFHPVTLRF